MFTGAIADILRTGAAGSAASGQVSVDDLFDAVWQRMLAADPPQHAVKSANRVSATIPIAARPHGRTPQPASGPHAGTGEEPAEPTGIPDWPTLLGYYIDAVRAEIGTPPLLDVRGDGYVVVPDRERALCSPWSTTTTVCPFLLVQITWSSVPLLTTPPRCGWGGPQSSSMARGAVAPRHRSSHRC